MIPFSVCMSVYRKDKPADFRVAVESIYHQSVVPDEIILVVDGPVPPALDEVIGELQDRIEILKVIRLAENKGHATARQTGLEHAGCELVAIMDSDDISLPNRFEKQVCIFESDPTVSVVGGLIAEFRHLPEQIVGVRSVPEHDREIKRYLKSRCPMNLVSVMMRKKDIQDVGGYIDWYCEEDYYLWVRLAVGDNHRFYNIQENLVFVRVGDEMYQRRGGWRYFKSEAALQKYMWRHRIISLPRLVFNVSGRFAVQVMMPNKVRGFVFRKLFRKQ